MKNSAKKTNELVLVAFFLLIFSISLCFGCKILAADEIDSGDIAIWHFNENSGAKAADSTPNHFDLNWYYNPYGGGRAIPERSAGRWDLGVYLDQREEVFAYFWPLENPIFFPSGLTIGAWIKTDLDSPELSRFFWLGNSQDYAGTPADSIILSVKNGLVYLNLKIQKQWKEQIFSSEPVNDNNWHFIVARLDPQNSLMAVFIDGQKQAEGELTSPIPYLETVNIGRREDYFLSANNNFRGSIDDVWLKKQAVSDEEVAAIYQSGQPYKSEIIQTPGIAPKLTAYYNFDDNPGVIARDSSENKYDLTWMYNPWGVGETVSRSVAGKFGQAVNFKKVEDLFGRGFDPEINFPNGVAIGVWIKTAENSQEKARIAWFGNSFNSIGDPASYFSVSEYQGKIKLDLRSAENYQYSLESGKVINDNEWHFLTVVLDQRPYEHYIKLYIDGEFDSQAFFPSPIPYIQSLNMGKRENYACGNACNFKGDIDDFFILDSVISGEKIKEIYDKNEPFSWPKRNPVIIVPGIIASYLNNAGNNEEIWPNFLNMTMPGNDSYLNALTLEENGFLNIDNPNIKPTEILRDINWSIFGFKIQRDFFTGLIQELKNNGYKEDVDLFVFPYDWRVDMNILAGDDSLWPGIYTLKEKINDVKLSVGAEKVDIIAHSMGGLVVKTYIKKNGQVNIDKFIDIATPHLGSPNAFKILNYGDNLEIPFLNKDRIRNISQNFPSIYQLLPSRAYFDIKDFGIPDKDYQSYAIDIDDIDNNGVKGDLNHDQTAEFLTNQGRNNILLNIMKVNENLHNQIDDLYVRNSFNIVGAGVPTIGKIYILNKEKNGKYEYGLKYINGDGTVPFRSAESFSDNLIYASGTHAYLPSVDGVRQVAVSILKGDIQSFDFSQFKNLSLDREKFEIKKATQISYHSPIELHIYDEFGNHAGPTANGDIEIGIPGVKYDVIEDNKFAILPAGGKYTITGQATAAGAFNARIENIENGQYVKEIYFNELPLMSSSTETELRVEDDQVNYAIKIDSDGDNIFEQEVAPSSILNSEELSDLTKPITEASISGTAGNNSYYISDAVVALNSSDDNSGILKTEHSLDGGSTWIKYTDPVVVSEEKENKIIYSSTDRAGNREDNKELIIKIDKSAPEILILTPEKINRNEILSVQYLANDNFSGLATDTVKIYFDGQAINNQNIDLFYKNLGEYEIKIVAEDLAGNQAEAETKIEIITDIFGVIADINRGYEEKMLNKKAKDSVLNDLKNIQKYIEKYGQKTEMRSKKEQELIAKCAEKKGQIWCEEKLGKIFNKIDYKLSEIHKKILKIQYSLVLKKFNLYYKLNWVKPDGYDIIKEDLEYLISKT